jgi:hypothetical protein
VLCSKQEVVKPLIDQHIQMFSPTCLGCILAEFCRSFAYFEANLSSLIESIVVLRVVRMLSFLPGISIKFERNALKSKNRRTF